MAFGLSLKRGEKPQKEGAAEAVIDAKIAKMAKKKRGSLKAIRKRTCFVLVIGDDGGILTYLEKGKVSRRIFAASPEEQNIKPVLELLSSAPKAPLYVLFDTMDQSYVRHTLPPVSSFSINKLVARRLSRDFAPEDIKGFIAMGRDKTGRKEWNYLLISAANSTSLQRWFEPILLAPNHFAGLYLLPIESQQFVSHLAIASGIAKQSEWQILLLHDKVSGFRQVVMQNGKLIFTRLTQLPADTPAEVMAGNIEQEIQNTIEYLRRISFHDDSGLDVYIIIAQAVRDAIDVQKISATHVKSFTPFDLSKLMELDQAALSGDRFADVVFSANFALRQKPALKMYTPYIKKLEQLAFAKLGVAGLAAVAALVLLYQSIMAVVGWQQAGSELESLQAQLRGANTEFEDAEKRFAALGDDKTRLVHVAALHSAIGYSEINPLTFIDQFAQIQGAGERLLGWSWRDEASIQATPDPNVPAPDPAAAAGEATTTSPPIKIIARVEFLDHNGDIRQLAAQVNAFTEKLNQTFVGQTVLRGLLPDEKRAAQQQNKVVLDLNAPAAEESYEVQAGDEIIDFVIGGIAPPSAEGENAAEGGVDGSSE